MNFFKVLFSIKNKVNVCLLTLSLVSEKVLNDERSLSLLVKQKYILFFVYSLESSKIF